MKPCRESRHAVSAQEMVCPQCGTPFSAREQWNGLRFEYRSEATAFGLPAGMAVYFASGHGRPVKRIAEPEGM